MTAKIFDRNLRDATIYRESINIVLMSNNTKKPERIQIKKLMRIVLIVLTTLLISFLFSVQYETLLGENIKAYLAIPTGLTFTALTILLLLEKSESSELLFTLCMMLAIAFFVFVAYELSIIKLSKLAVFLTLI